MKARVYSFSLLAIIATLYIVGSCRAGIWLVKDDTPEHADAMVLLMGGISNRVLQAADLYTGGRADRLIIVEESMGAYKKLEERGASIISSTKQMRDAAIAMGIPAENITVLPGDARSTLEEAIIVRDYLTANAAIDTIILVTAPPHTRRASMIFKAALRDSETPVYVGCSPSAYSNFNADRWWKDKEGIQTVLSEFVKIGSFVVFERKKLGVN